MLRDILPVLLVRDGDETDSGYIFTDTTIRDKELNALNIPQLQAICRLVNLVPELVEGLADCMCCYQPGSSTYNKLQNLLAAAKAALGDG